MTKKPPNNATHAKNIRRALIAKRSKSMKMSVIQTARWAQVRADKAQMGIADVDQNPEYDNAGSPDHDLLDLPDGIV